MTPTLAFALLALVSAVISAPNDGFEGRLYQKPLSSISPDDKRQPDGSSISGHYAVVSPKRKWPLGVVPWQYETGITFTDSQKKIIETGLQQIMNATCLKFRAKTDADTAFVTIRNNDTGCYGGYGYTGDKVVVNMASDCYGDTSTLIHEMMHVLGFDHEQTRYDRDMYVEIQWENIQAGQEHNFQKYPRTKAYPRYPYDLFSVMQYFLTAFGVGGRPTMILTDSSIDGQSVGNANSMSRSDILRMRSAYKCDFNGESGGIGRLDYNFKESNYAKNNYFF